jgi:hypothetical protein
MEVEGYPNYLIYEDGSVYSNFKKKYLKHSTDGDGYKQVCLYNDKKQKTWKVYRLVALHYIPNPHNYPEVDHIDRDKCNNHLYNLRWVNRSMNCQNKDIQINNKLGIKNISFHKSSKKYRFQKKINDKIHEKKFKTLEEAIQYKEEYLHSLSIE